MVLKVEIVQSPQGVVMPEVNKTISEQGGSFGRGENNTWILDDPERFLSSRHCEFSFESGQYFVTDVSTNGTFMNGSPEPLGRGARAALQNGDTIEIGEYKFRINLETDSGAFDSVSLDPFASPASPFDVDMPSAPANSQDPLAFGNDFGAMSDSPVPDLGSSETDPLAALDKAAADPFSKPADPFDPRLQSNNVGTESFPYGQNTYSDGGDPLAGAFDAPSAPGGLIPEDWEDDDLLGPGSEPVPSVAPTPVPPTPALEPARAAPKPAPRPRPAAPVESRRDISQPNRVLRKAPPKAAANPSVKKPTPRKTPAASEQSQQSAKALIAAMGLDTNKLSPQEQIEIAATVGELMPVVVEGMMRVLRSRASIKNEFRMSVTTIQPVENNPLKFSADREEAMENMFVRKSKAYKAPVDAFSEGFDAIAEHQVAIIAGIRAAFSKMVEHFNPEILEQQFDKQTKGVALPGMQKARYWTSYNEYFQSFLDNMEQSFQNLFGDEFVRAYEDQLFKLMAARNNDNKL